MPGQERARSFCFGLMCLLAAAAACAAVTATRADDGSSVDYEKLARQLDRATRNEDYAKALAIAEQMHDIAPKHIMTLYNIARLHCLLGHKKKAYDWLGKAIDAGYSDVWYLMKDHGFASIRGEGEFRTIVRRGWAAGMDRYIAMLEREERAEYQKPDEVVAALALKAGERVADIGAGSGYFTIPVAKAVGPTGVVWAIDIHQEMLDYIKDRLEAENLQNVRMVKVPKDDPRLPKDGVDTILMVDTLHYIHRRTEYAKKLRAGLAPGGRVVIIDFVLRSMEERPWGPPPELQISRQTVDAEFAKAGLKPAKVHDFLPEQYFVEYRPE